jgi:hypothetical protein
MTQEEKQILLKELCTRFPYGVICKLSAKDADVSITEKLDIGGLEHFIAGAMDVLPYLRPMSSMTEEEQRTLDSMCNGVEMVSRLSGLKMFDKAFDWLYSKHLDVHNLIPSLALEAPEGMYD